MSHEELGLLAADAREQAPERLAKESECRHCGNPIRFDSDGEWREPTTYLNCTPAESADMARQCCMTTRGCHEPR